MYIHNLSIDGFKNLYNIDVTLGKGLNIFYGDNAQGKTNIMEALWLFTGCRSFRGTKDKDIINFDGSEATAKINFFTNYRENTAKYTFKKGSALEKQAFLNNIKLGGIPKFFGEFKSVLFIPEDLALAKGSPEKRRYFSDLSVSQLKYNYYRIISKYENILSQRNALLKRFRNNFMELASLDGWDFQIARTGAYISLTRHKYCNLLCEKASKLYYEMTEGKEFLNIYYETTVLKSLVGRRTFKGILNSDYLDAVKNATKEDIKNGFTSVGCHRDDIVIEINGRPTRNVCSQGQARSISLVMKIAQAYLIKEFTGEYPVLMLDDVMSELDEKRQEFILNCTKDIQVIVTACDDKILKFAKNAKVFQVENGRIIDRNNY